MNKFFGYGYGRVEIREREKEVRKESGAARPNFPPYSAMFAFIKRKLENRILPKLTFFV